MKHLHLLYTFLFGVAVFLFFGLVYPHHLHYQEQYQLFLFDSTYVWEIVKLPGGFADLLGRFCTQFFLFAWMGALIIALLLSAVQLLTLRLTCWGPFYGLSFVPSFLLWLFLLNENALLGGVWAVLLTLLASWAYDALPCRGWIRRILLIAAIPILYYLAGPICLVFFMLQATGEKGKNETDGKTSVKEAYKKSRVNGTTLWYCGVFLLLVIMPFILSYCVPVPASNLWFGIHYHRYPTEVPVLLWSAALSVFFLTLIVRAFNNRFNASSRFVVTLFSFALVATIMGGLVWKSSNFKAEKVMKYDFMARFQQWNRILETINADKPNNQIGVTVQNLALGMHGLLSKHLFDYNQNGVLGLLPDIGTDAISPLPTSEAFYQLGMTAVAQRTVFEAQEAILDFQKSGRCYKRLAQTNLILGNYEVASKYLTALQKTLFYREWANETLPLLGDEKAIAKHPEYGRLRQLAYKEDFFFGDHVTSEMLQSLFLSNTDNRLAYEYLKAYYMLTGDRENYTKLLLHYH
jgi:hypothetical protein